MKARPRMQRLYYASRSFVKRNSATILTCMGGAGVVVTAVMSAKATPKALYAVEMARKEKECELTKLEVVRAAAPAYIPTALVGMSTIICIFGSNFISKRNQAALISSYAFLENRYKEYRKKAEEIIGEGTDKRIQEAIVKEKYIAVDPPKPPASTKRCLFYEDHYGKFFESTMEDVLAAEYCFNRNFVLRGYACLNEFLDLLGVGHIAGGDTIGWSMEAGDMFYGYAWVDFEHELVRMDDGLEIYMITTLFPPTADFIDTEDYE